MDELEMLYSLTCAKQRGVIVSIVSYLLLNWLSKYMVSSDGPTRLISHLWRTGDIEDPYTNPKYWIKRSVVIFKRFFFILKRQTKWQDKDRACGWKGLMYVCKTVSSSKRTGLMYKRGEIMELPLNSTCMSYTFKI